MKIISISNNKGGVAKTSTCVNLAYALSKKYKVLLIDLDSQCSLTVYYGYEEPELTIYNVINKECELSKSIIPINKNIGLVPGSAEMTLIKNKFNLKEFVQDLKYDYILIDNGPSFGVLQASSLISSDYIIAPCEPTYLAYRGLQGLSQALVSIRKINPSVKLLGVLITMYANTLHHNEIIAEIKTKYPVFKTVIKRSIKFPDACLGQMSIIEYVPKFEGSKAYLEFAKEVVEHVVKTND